VGFLREIYSFSVICSILVLLWWFGYFREFTGVWRWYNIVFLLFLVFGWVYKVYMIDFSGFCRFCGFVVCAVSFGILWFMLSVVL